MLMKSSSHGPGQEPYLNPNMGNDTLSPPGAQPATQAGIRPLEDGIAAGGRLLLQEYVLEWALTIE